MRNRVEIQELADEAGLALAGVAPAEPLKQMQERLQQRLSENRGTVFEEKDPLKRISAEHLLAGCRSIIVVGQPHPVSSCHIPLSHGPRGVVARCAQSLDYHQLLAQKAELLVELLKREFGKPLNYRILVDRNPLVERELARMAGIGLVAENCTIITPDFGSHVALGTILIDQELEPQEPLEDGCDSCGLCRKACPTGAFSGPYTLNSPRCLSYLTQTPGVVPREFRPYFGSRLYGCDTCQDVCPHNQNVSSSPEISFSFFPGEPLLLPMLRMTQKEFAQTIGLSAAGWRGKTTLQRNVIIALGNSSDPTAAPELVRLLREDPRPVIRLHAAWALGCIGNKTAHRALAASLHHENDQGVLLELRDALDEEPL